MKPKINTLLLALFLSCSCSPNNEIGKCYISYNTASGLKVSEIKRLPETTNKSRELMTTHGKETIKCIDGYRVLYNNSLNGIFVNLKVELSNPDSYGTDTINLGYYSAD